MDPHVVTSACDSSLPGESGGASTATPRTLSKNKSGNVLNSTARKIIFHCYNFWRAREPECTVEHTAAFVADMLGIGARTVFAVKKEAQATGGVLSTPSRKRPRNSEKKRRSALYDSFTLNALRSCVHDVFRRNEIPMVAKITKEFSERTGDPSLKPWTVRRLLREIGFKREKRSRNSLLLDREDILAWRHEYLRDIRRYRAENRQIFYLDETWVTAGHTTSTVWTDTTVKSSADAFRRGLTTGLKQPSGKGQRVIVTHIGSKDGFVDGCLDVFRGKKTGDYHEEMDGPRFEGWFDGVLQRLPSGSVIVMDNASYHSRRNEAVPTTNSLKGTITEWLDSKGVQYGAGLTKKQLLEIVARVKPRFISYRVDTAAQKAGFIVVRLPPYHCEFNPIELIWAQVKNAVAAANTTFNITHVEQLLKDKVAEVTAEHWREAVRHVQTLEEKFQQVTCSSDHIDPIVITLEEDDESTSDDATASDSDISGVWPVDEL